MIYDYNSNTLIETINIQNNLFTDPVITAFSEFEHQLTESSILVNGIINQANDCMINALLEANNTTTTDEVKKTSLSNIAKKVITQIKNIISAIGRFVSSYFQKIMVNIGRYDKFIENISPKVKEQLKNDDFRRPYEISETLLDIVMGLSPNMVIHYNGMVSKSFDEYYRTLTNMMINKAENGAFDKLNNLATAFSSTMSDILNELTDKKIYRKIKSDLTNDITDVTKSVKKKIVKQLKASDIRAYMNALINGNELLKKTKGRTIDTYNRIKSECEQLIKIAEKGLSFGRSPEEVSKISSAMGKMNNLYMRNLNAVNKLIYYLVGQSLKEAVAVLSKFVTPAEKIDKSRPIKAKWEYVD